MKKYRKEIAVTIVLCLLLGAVAYRVVETSNSLLPTLNGKNGRVILIDPGHGGSDPGAVSARGTKESALNMRIAMFLAEYLMSYGYEIRLTRGYKGDALGMDEGLSSNERKRIFLETDHTLAVSIHMNKYSDESVKGAETFYYSQSEESRALAELVQSSLVAELDPTNKRQIKGSSDLYVLKTGRAPAVLVECGYISNPTEEMKLLTTEYQRKVAFAICCGIMRYCEAYGV